MLACNTFDIERHTVAGIYLGQASVLRADASMIERVFGKIVKGLDFADFGDVLGSTPIAVYQILGPESVPNAARDVIRMIAPRQVEHVTYRFGRTVEDPVCDHWRVSSSSIAWALSFHQTRPSPTAARPAMRDPAWPTGTVNDESCLSTS